jgi:hypothetical protein
VFVRLGSRLTSPSFGMYLFKVYKEVHHENEQDFDLMAKVVPLKVHW